MHKKRKIVKHICKYKSNGDILFMKKDWIRGKTVVVSGAGNGLGKYLTYNLVTFYNCKVIGIDIDEISYLPKEKITLNEEDKIIFEKVLALLDDVEDVQNVYHNVEL